MLADRDREADTHLPADRDDLRGIEARVGPHREHTAGSGRSDPADRLGQEAGGAPDRVGATVAQTRHEHVAGPGADREPGVIAAHTGVPVVESTLLRETVCLADRRVEIDRQGPAGRSGPGRPGPRQEFAADPVELGDVTPAEAAQERARGGCRLDPEAKHRFGASSPERAAAPRSRWASTSAFRPRWWASVAGRRSPASATRRSSSKAVSSRSRLCDDRINQVLLYPGRWVSLNAIFPVQKGT